MSLAMATRLGPYEIVAPIGAGGMGEVYRAKDTRLDRTVAIKIVSRALAGDAATPQPSVPTQPPIPRPQSRVVSGHGVLRRRDAGGAARPRSAADRPGAAVRN